MNNKDYKATIGFVVWFSFILVVAIWMFSITKNSSSIEPVTIQQNTGKSSGLTITGTEKKTILKEELIGFNVDKKTCNPFSLDGFEYVDIFDGEVRNKKNNYIYYTNQFSIKPGFTEAYLCIVANVVPELQNRNGKYYLGILFNDSDYQGLVNVGYSLSSGLPYDYTSQGASSKLDGRMYGVSLKENDKTYWLDLANLIVWNKDGGSFKIIRPIDKLNSGQPEQRIGGYISAGENGIIKKFRIFYKGGSIKPI